MYGKVYLKSYVFGKKKWKISLFSTKCGFDQQKGGVLKKENLKRQKHGGKENILKIAKNFIYLF